MRMPLFFLLAAGTLLFGQNENDADLRREASAAFKAWKEAVPGIDGLIRAAQFGKPFTDLALEELMPQASKLTQDQRLELLSKDLPNDFRSRLLDDFLAQADDAELNFLMSHLIYRSKKGDSWAQAAQRRCCDALLRKPIETLEALNAGELNCHKFVSRITESFFSFPHSDLELFSIISQQSGEGFIMVYGDDARARALRQLLSQNRSKTELLMLLGRSRHFPDIREEITRRLLSFPLTAKERVEVDRILLPRLDGADISYPEAPVELYDRIENIKSRFLSVLSGKQ